MSGKRTSRWGSAQTPSTEATQPTPPWRLTPSTSQWGSSSDSWQDSGRNWQDTTASVSAGDWSDQRSWAQPYAATSKKVTWNDESSWDSGYDASTTTSTGFHGASTYTTVQEDVSTEEWPAEESFQLVPPSPSLKRRIPLAPTIGSFTFNLDGKRPIEKTEKDAHSQARLYQKVLTNANP